MCEWFILQVKEMKVYRDNNKNQILDYNEATIEEGIFGINIHRTNPLGFSKNVYFSKRMEEEA